MNRPALHELTKRIGEYELETRRMVFPKPNPSAWSTEREFLNNAIEIREVLVRLYWEEELMLWIVIPDDYAKELDAVRSFRLALEGHPDGTFPEIDPALLRRALPEDFLPDLEVLPSTYSIRELCLLNEANPVDPFHRERLGNPDFVSQASTNRNTVTFFRKDLDAWIGDEIRHEWAHIARTEAPSASHYFDLAVDHEAQTYIPRDRALANREEYWAVLLGEEMLSPDEERFLELTRQVPLQSVMLAMAVGTLIPSYQAENEKLATLRARLAYVQERVAPVVAEQLVAQVIRHAGEAIANTAARLLIGIGWGHRLNEIPTLKSLNLSGEPVGAFTLAWMKDNRFIEELDLSRTYVGESFEFLVNLPLRSLSIAHTKTRASRLYPLTQIPTLQRLDLSHTYVGAMVVHKLERMKELEWVDLREVIDPDGLTYLPELVADFRKKRPQIQIEL